jgi:hypothetical protein
MFYTNKLIIMMDEYIRDLEINFQLANKCPDYQKVMERIKYHINSCIM